MQREHGKFVTPESSDQVAVSNCGNQSLGDDDQKFVAAAMSIDIIHLFESVKVEEEDCMRGSSSWRRGDRSTQRFVKLPPVCKAGKGILEGQGTSALLGQDTLPS